MFLISILYLIKVSIIVIISKYLHALLVDGYKLQEVEGSIKQKKSISKSTFEEQSKYIDLLEVKSNIIYVYRMHMLLIIIVSIILSIYMKGGQSLYLFGFRMGLIFIILYVIFFSFIFSYVTQRFINK